MENFQNSSDAWIWPSKCTPNITCFITNISFVFRCTFFWLSILCSGNSKIEYSLTKFVRSLALYYNFIIFYYAALYYNCAAKNFLPQNILENIQKKDACDVNKWSVRLTTHKTECIHGALNDKVNGRPVMCRLRKFIRSNTPVLLCFVFLFGILAERPVCLPL